MAQKIKGMADKLDKDTAVLADSDRQRRQREVADLDREFQRKQREFREDLNQRRNEELAQVLERANRVIRQLAEQRKYDLIVQEAVYVNPRIDITDDVMKALNAGAR
ncbi:Outer membrane protein (OmpH-like) [compost metagenome]